MLGVLELLVCGWFVCLSYGLFVAIGLFLFIC